ncbi:MAG: methylenetetrahydrofolate reductase [NAD(P)H] [Gemmatimonadaceae bacterium]|jgi:methylenetetrahydrofolate reductase (NADPH)|nr:methylenetetrahydrofolate reductase [NAD(P)H] [Gemmatimonadaceae bacterium]
MSPSILHRPAGRDLAVSFEFFPPRSAEMDEQLWRAIQRLAPLGPSYVSVTYGAGGSTRERTHATVKRLVDETPLAPAAHLTCVAASRAEILEVADQYWAAGVRHIVALRGDPPTGPGQAYEPHPEGFAYASDLVVGLRARHDFEISVAAYPEGHPQATSLAADVDNLKRKVDAGATRAITQFFFDNGMYFRFVDKCRAAGITVPIVPGIMPIMSYAQACRFAGMCGATIPSGMARHFEGLDDDPETRKLVAAALATEQCTKLADHGVDELHFYTLNRADLTYAICHMLGLRAQPAVATSAA